MMEIIGLFIVAGVVWTIALLVAHRKDKEATRNWRSVGETYWREDE